MATADQVSLTASTTESAVVSESIAPASTSASISVLLSEAASEAASVSESNSVSTSTSASVSVSESAVASTTESQSTVLSESTASTTATSSETAVTTPQTKEEARVVLEQVTSEAEILVDLGQKELAEAADTNLETAVSATKAEIAAAKVVLGNTSATVEEIQAQVVAIKTANDSLGTELLKRDEDGVLTAMLADINASAVNEGNGTFNEGGVALIEPNPDMQDPHKAEAQSSTQGTMVATTTDGYLTFKYFPFSAWYDGTVGSGNGYGLSSSNGAYIRASIAKDLSGTVLLELVDKSNNILETKTVAPGETAEFTTFQDSAGGRPVVAEYDATTASSTSTGTLKVLYDENTLQPNVQVPGVVANTTTYVTEAGEVLGTYTIATIPGLTTIPSDVRDFPGFDYVRSEKTSVDVTPQSSVPYVIRARQGYPTSGEGKTGKYIAYKSIATPIAGTHDYTEAIYVADPNYTGTHDYRSTTTEGFIKVFESSVLSKGVTNTNSMLPASFLDTYTVTKLTTDPNDSTKQIESDPITDASQLDLNTLKAGEWFKLKLKENPDYVYLSRFQIGPATTGSVSRLSLHFGRDFNPDNPTDPGETTDPVTGEKVSGLDLTGITLPYTFSYAGVEMTETTHIYKKNEDTYNSLSDSLSESGSESASTSASESASTSASESASTSASESASESETAKTGSVVVNYVDTEGNVIKAPVTDTANAAVGTDYDTTDNKPTEIVTEDGTRYVLVPSKTVGSENGTVVEGETSITYVYQKVANWIPQIPGVPSTEYPEIPYPFDPNNPDVPVTPTPDTVIPYVPGYTPVDPEDPTKGYVPPTPENPGVDTPIPYVPAETAKTGSVVVNYVDSEGNVIKAPVTDTANAAVGTDYDTTDNKPTEIVTEDGTRYVLVPSKTVGSENGTVVEGETSITYVYQKVANWIPQIPGVPSTEYPEIPYPFDPNNPDVPVTPTPDTVIPYVPGYTPVDPKDNTPLIPVDPEDPTKGYVPPTPETPGVDTPIPYVPVGTDPVDPSTPVKPGQPTPDAPKPVVPAQPGQPAPKAPVATPAKPAAKSTLKSLPNTGEEANTSAVLAGLGLLTGAGLLAKRRKNDGNN